MIYDVVLIYERGFLHSMGTALKGSEYTIYSRQGNVMRLS